MLAARQEECYGCTACKHVCGTNAIAISIDKEGFMYPNINEELCTDCGLCEKVCPGKKNYNKQIQNKSPLIYAVKHIQDNVRLNSTSGGAFTALSDLILERKGIVYGTVFAGDFSVVHRRAKTTSQRDEMRGSKYVQSDLNNIFLDVKNDLLAGQWVMFTGTPCQCAGLNEYMGGIDKSRLLICDLVCYGTPSPLIWQEYVTYIKQKYQEQIVDVKFRSKDFGWKTEIMIIKMSNTQYQKSGDDDVFYQLYNKNVMLRPSCHACQFTSAKRAGDITLGDFWGIDQVEAEFDDDKGVSLVMVNSKKGKEFWETVNNNLEYIPQELAIAQKEQPNLKQPTPASSIRDIFWQDFYDKGFSYLLEKYTD